MTDFSSLVIDRLYPDERDVDAVTWVHDRLGEETWSKQDEILRSIEVNRKTAVKSAHGVGKSHIASRIAAYWIDTHRAGEAFVVSTAPSFPQVRAIMWRYIGQAHRKGHLVGRVNQTEWHIGDEIVGYGRKPADYDETGFQGIHAPFVLVVIDEACGVPASLWVAVDSLVTNERCRILAIGNPDDPASHFAEVCESPDWNTITISAFDSPNFTDEPVSEALSQQLVDRVWVEEAKRSYGEDSPIYISKVLGEFPEDAADGIIPGSAIAKCRRQERVHNHLPCDDVQLGVDVGAGGDQSVIRKRRGSVAGRVWRSRHDDPNLLTSEIMAAIRESGATRVCIDVIGIGWGIKGNVERIVDEENLPVVVVGVNVGHASRQPKRFINIRAEIWWEVGRELSLSGGWNLEQIDDQTAADLAAPKYFLTKNGRVQVEKKDDVRDRIGRSPDDADALLLAFYRGGSTRAIVHKLKDPSRRVMGGRPGRATVGAR